MTELVNTYLGTWNETDPAARRALMAAHWSPDVTYIDPMADVQGHAGLDAVIAAVHDQFPGLVFTALGTVDAHHQQARFRWGLGPADAEPVIEGFDVVTTDEHGQFVNVLGFLDKLPASA